MNNYWHAYKVKGMIDYSYMYQKDLSSQRIYLCSGLEFCFWFIRSFIRFLHLFTGSAMG